MNGSLSRRRLLAIGIQGVTASFVLAACSSTTPGSSDDPAALVSDADMTLNNFLRDPEMTWFRDNLPSARGVLIVPQFARAGSPRSNMWRAAPDRRSCGRRAECRSPPS